MIDLQDPTNARLLDAERHAVTLQQSRASLAEQLGALTAAAETDTPGVLASILLLDRKHLRLGAAPSLPTAYNRAIDGIAIGPTVGSCGTAAYGGHTVLVYDIATDPLWADFKDLALAHGLRSCWSAPIRTLGGEIVGTFALYHRVPTTPTMRQRAVVDRLARTAAQLIERHRGVHMK